jgi:hypothetical protein
MGWSHRYAVGGFFVPGFFISSGRMNKREMKREK